MILFKTGTKLVTLQKKFISNNKILIWKNTTAEKVQTINNYILKAIFQDVLGLVLMECIHFLGS